MKIVPAQQVVAQLAAALGPMPAAPVLLHVDLARVGIVVDSLAPRAEMLERFWQCLAQAAGPRPLVLPTFNYDFCRTGRYQPASDPCQVGALNEHVRSRHPVSRTRTPIFNFVYPPELPLAPGPATNVFGADSTFAELHRLDACVGFLGTDFSSNTFKHFVEEGVGVGYRYPKRFAGMIEMPGANQPVSVTYRVRPRGTSMRYDNPRLEEECRGLGLLHESPVGAAALRWFRMPDLHAYWAQALARDEFHLLDDASRAEAGELYRLHGRPLRQEQFEPEAATRPPALETAALTPSAS